MRVRNATPEDEARAALRGMALDKYMVWRKQLRDDYKVIAPYRAFARCTGLLGRWARDFDVTTPEPA